MGALAQSLPLLCSCHVLAHESVSRGTHTYSCLAVYGRFYPQLSSQWGKDVVPTKKASIPCCLDAEGLGGVRPLFRTILPTQKQQPFLETLSFTTIIHPCLTSAQAAFPAQCLRAVHIPSPRLVYR